MVTVAEETSIVWSEASVLLADQKVSATDFGSVAFTVPMVSVFCCGANASTAAKSRVGRTAFAAGLMSRRTITLSGMNNELFATPIVPTRSIVRSGTLVSAKLGELPVAGLAMADGPSATRA